MSQIDQAGSVRLKTPGEDDEVIEIVYICNLLGSISLIINTHQSFCVLIYLYIYSTRPTETDQGYVGSCLRSSTEAGEKGWSGRTAIKLRRRLRMV